jgi:hypothetical protein
MHAIYTTAAVTSAIAAVAFGVLLRQCTQPIYWRSLGAVWTMGLLMSPAAYYLVRVPALVTPLTPWLDAQTPKGGGQLIAADIVRLSFAPLTEEPAKLLPWVAALLLGWPLLPARKLATPIAATLGFGFATGEMWLVAHLIAEANPPELAGVPWYGFGGYANERLMTCLTHALFALPTVWLARRGWRGALLGLALGMTLHFLGNAPIMLLRRDAGGLGAVIWTVLVQLWVLAFTIAALLGLTGVHLGRQTMRRVLRGRMICPECHAEYRQPILALNAGAWRYEQCGACRKWHWVSLQNLAPLTANEVTRSTDDRR